MVVKGQNFLEKIDFLVEEGTLSTKKFTPTGLCLEGVMCVPYMSTQYKIAWDYLFTGSIFIHTGDVGN